MQEVCPYPLLVLLVHEFLRTVPDLRENEARGAVQVVDPARMTVSIEQKGHPPQIADEHYLVVGREYTMKVFLYDRLDHFIFYNAVRFCVDVQCISY